MDKRVVKKNADVKILKLVIVFSSKNYNKTKKHSFAGLPLGSVRVCILLTR